MMKVVRIVLSVSVLTLSGCGWYFSNDSVIRDRANEYLKDAPAPRMELPDGVTDYQTEDYLLIPPVAEEQAAKPLPEEYEVPKPPALLLSEEDPQTPPAGSVALSDLEAPTTGQSGQTIFAELVSDSQGRPVLRFSQGFDETWDVVGEALKAAQIKISDLNRTQQFYSVIDADDDEVQLQMTEQGDMTLVKALDGDVPVENGVAKDLLEQILNNMPK